MEAGIVNGASYADVERELCKAVKSRGDPVPGMLFPLYLKCYLYPRLPRVLSEKRDCADRSLS